MYCQNLGELNKYEARVIGQKLRDEGITELREKEVRALDIIRNDGEKMREDFCKNHCTVKGCIAKGGLNDKVSKLEIAIAK